MQVAWKKAEDLSEASGKPWTDRFGNLRNAEAEPIGLTRTVLQELRRLRGLPP